MENVTVSLVANTTIGEEVFVHFSKVQHLQSIRDVLAYLREHFGKDCIPSWDESNLELRLQKCIMFRDPIWKSMYLGEMDIPRWLLVFWYDTHQAEKAEDGNISHSG